MSVEFKSMLSSMETKITAINTNYQTIRTWLAGKNCGVTGSMTIKQTAEALTDATGDQKYVWSTKGVTATKDDLLTGQKLVNESGTTVNGAVTVITKAGITATASDGTVTIAKNGNVVATAITLAATDLGYGAGSIEKGTVSEYTMPINVGSMKFFKDAASTSVTPEELGLTAITALTFIKGTASSYTADVSAPKESWIGATALNQSVAPDDLGLALLTSETIGAAKTEGAYTVTVTVPVGQYVGATAVTKTVGPDKLGLVKLAASTVAFGTGDDLGKATVPAGQYTDSDTVVPVDGAYSSVALTDITKAGAVGAAPAITLPTYGGKASTKALLTSTIAPDVVKISSLYDTTVLSAISSIPSDVTVINPADSKIATGGKTVVTALPTSSGYAITFAANTYYKFAAATSVSFTDLGYNVSSGDDLEGCLLNGKSLVDNTGKVIVGSLASVNENLTKGTESTAMSISAPAGNIAGFTHSTFTQFFDGITGSTAATSSDVLASAFYVGDDLKVHKGGIETLTDTELTVTRGTQAVGTAIQYNINASTTGLVAKGDHYSKEFLAFIGVTGQVTTELNNAVSKWIPNSVSVIDGYGHVITGVATYENIPDAVDHRITLTAAGQGNFKYYNSKNLTIGPDTLNYTNLGASQVTPSKTDGTITIAAYVYTDGGYTIDKDTVLSATKLDQVTASNGDVLSSKKYVDSTGTVQEGSMPEKSQSDIKIADNTASIPSGYYGDDCTVTHVINEADYTKKVIAGGNMAYANGVSGAGYFDVDGKFIEATMAAAAITGVSDDVISHTEGYLSEAEIKFSTIFGTSVPVAEAASNGDIRTGKKALSRTGELLTGQMDDAVVTKASSTDAMKITAGYLEANKEVGDLVTGTLPSVATVVGVSGKDILLSNGKVSAMEEVATASSIPDAATSTSLSTGIYVTDSATYTVNRAGTTSIFPGTSGGTDEIIPVNTIVVDKAITGKALSNDLPLAEENIVHMKKGMYISGDFDISFVKIWAQIDAMLGKE